MGKQVKIVRPGKPGQTTPTTKPAMAKAAPTLPVTGKGPTSIESMPPK
jgi:hypothetical protein